MHFIKGNIGCGMLAMGEAFKIGGLYLTLFILLYVWLISVYNMHVLVSCSIEYIIYLKKKKHIFLIFSKSIFMVLCLQQ